MQHRNLREDALEESAASLRMADGILRELVEAGAVEGDPDDLATTLLAVTCDEIVGMALDLSDVDTDAGIESSPDSFSIDRPSDAADSTRVFRLTRRKLEALARLIEGAGEEPSVIE